MPSGSCRCQTLGFIDRKRTRKEDPATGCRHMFLWRSILEGEPSKANTVLSVDALWAGRDCCGCLSQGEARVYICSACSADRILAWYLCFPSGIFHSPALRQGTLTERAPTFWLSSVVELRTGSAVSHGWALNDSTWVNKSLTWNFCWNSLREVSEQGKWTLEVWVATRLPPGKNRLRMIPTVPRATASLLAWYHESSFVLKSVWEASRGEDSARWPSSQRDWYPQVFPFCFEIRHWRPFFSGQGVTSQVG